MTGGKWLATARAAHTRAMGAAQRFPLLGDGSETRAALARGDAAESAELAGAALAEARYRDWHTARATGALDAVASPGAAYLPPALELTPDDAPAAVQTRLVLPTRARADRLAEAELIIRGLVAEFEDIFPDELAAAIRFLRQAA